MRSVRKVSLFHDSRDDLRWYNPLSWVRTGIVIWVLFLYAEAFATRHNMAALWRRYHDKGGSRMGTLRKGSPTSGQDPLIIPSQQRVCACTSTCTPGKGCLVGVFDPRNADPKNNVTEGWTAWASTPDALSDWV